MTDSNADFDQDASIPILDAVPLVRAMIQKGTRELAPFHSDAFAFRPTTGRMRTAKVRPADDIYRHLKPKVNEPYA